MTEAVNPYTGRPTGDRGTAAQAIEFALDGSRHDNDDCNALQFLTCWRRGLLDEWPDFYVWLADQDGDEAARILAPVSDVGERASDTRYIEACLEELADPAWVPNRNVWRDLCEAALTAIPIPAPTGEDAPTRDDWNWLFKSVERGLFDKATSAKGALLILANYPGAPWKMGRWNVDHKPYAAEFYKHFPRAALTDHTTKGAE